MAQVHDETHTADNCAECQRNTAAGSITIHYWEAAPITLREGIEPCATYNYPEPGNDAPDYCAYCDEGWMDDYETIPPHHHDIYVTREGASHRTADEMARLIHDDTAALTTYVVPDDLPDPDGWCEDPDDSEMLSDSIADAVSALSDAGLWATWNDGYVIERVTIEGEGE